MDIIFKEESEMGLLCPKPDHGKLISHLMMGEKKVGESRLVCSTCFDDDCEIWIGQYQHQISIEMKQIVQYEQPDPVTGKENKLELRLPQNKEIKKQSLEQIKSYLNDYNKNINQIHEISNHLKSGISDNIQNLKAKGNAQFQTLQEAGDKLRRNYQDIFDCIYIGDTFEDNDSKGSIGLDEYKTQSQDQVEKIRKCAELCKQYKMLYSLYTTDIGTKCINTCIQLAKQINFNSNEQNNFRDVPIVFDESITIKNPKKITFFQKLSDEETLNNYFEISPFPDSSETLIQKKEGLSKALSSFPLDHGSQYQIVFEVDVPELFQFISKSENFIMIGVSPITAVQTKKVQKCLILSKSPSEQGCSISQYGNNLSQLTKERTVIVMNICIDKNIFYFSDEFRNSKQILKTPANFLSKQIYHILIQVKGFANVKLVEFTCKNN